ncbi:MAG: hypothetical protein IPN76_14580 [Saprospiraceae bacterium]|nr:hypothetical protein [Saprospiraceae bacterium]
MKAFHRSVLFLAILLVGCSRSAIYSPSLLLGKSPLKAKEVDFQGNIELMPEARPQALGGKQTTVGVVGQFGYGFGERFGMSLKAWYDIEHREDRLRSGYSLCAQFVKEKAPNSRLIFIPKIGITLWLEEVNGYGASTAVVYHQTIGDKIGCYGGLELAWGTNEFFKENSPALQKEVLPMGFAALAHLGVAGELLGRFRVNAELTPVYQFNYFDDNQQFMVSPTIGVGYAINPKGKPKQAD